MLSDDQITQIRERLQKATGQHLEPHDGNWDVECEACYKTLELESCAKEDIAALLALVDQLRQERDRWEGFALETANYKRAEAAEAASRRLRTALEGLRDCDDYACGPCENCLTNMDHALALPEDGGGQT